MELFRLHLAKMPISNRRAVALFNSIFLKEEVQSITQLQLIFGALDDHYLSYEDVRRVIDILLTNTPVRLLYQLKLTGSESE